MRPSIAAFSLVVAGCSVEMGEGQITPISLDQPFDATAVSPPVSVDLEFEFLSADDSATLASQYSTKQLDAIDHVDVEVKQLGIDTDNGTTVSGAMMVLSFESISVDQVGQRKRLPDSTRKAMVDAIKNRQAFTLPLHVDGAWPMPPASELMDAFVVMQPIVVVNGFKATF
jgi:hypothetical protein